MIFFQTLKDLLRLLDWRGRAIAGLLVGLLAVSGALEIVSLFFLFGYISALGGEGGKFGATMVSRVYEFFAGGLEGAPYALVAGAVLVAVFAFKNALWLFSSFSLTRFAMKQYERVAGALFDGYQLMPLDLVRGRGTAEPARVLGSVLSVFRTGFNPLLEASADVAIILAMVVALMMAVDPELVIGAVVVLGLVGGAFLLYTRKLSQSLGERVFKAQGDLGDVTNEALRGLLDVRLAGRQDLMRSRFSRVAGEFALADRRMRALDLMPRALNEIVLAAGIALAAIWFASSSGGLAGALPTLAVLGFAGLRVTAAVSRLTRSLQLMRQAAPGRSRLMQNIERAAPALLEGDAHRELVAESYKPDSKPLPPGVSPTLSRGISVQSVSFTYPDTETPAVDAVSLEVPAGSFTALCGPSGGGKSTLALLMMGLLRPQSGAVRCDGWDVQDHLDAWHAQIGHVGQNPFFAPRSVRENVAFGMRAKEIDDDAVWRALEAAAVADVFRNSPRGLGTLLGEDGLLLSGGQRQRIAIARALYRDPAVLVFDEATAALDTQTEREVTSAITSLRNERTIIAIAHRLTTIEAADTIHLVSAGRIAASGTFAQLIATSAEFRRLAGQAE